MQYYKQDLNNQITVLSLLAHGLPSYKTLTPINSNPIVLNGKMNAETNLIASSAVKDDAEDIWDAANTTDLYEDSYTAVDFFTGNASESYTQRILYAMANVLVPKNYHTNNCNATYISNIRKAIIVNGKEVYIVDCHNENALVAIAYPKTKKTLNQIYINCLHKIATKPIGAYSKALNAMQTLWFMQAKKHHFNKVPSKKPKNKPLPKDFKILLSQLLVDITHYKKSHQITNMTFQDLIDFYHEVQNGHVTSKTHKAQEWLFSQHTHTKASSDDKRTQVLRVMKLHPNFYQAVKNIKKIDIADPDIQMIIAQMNKDKYLRRSKFHVVAAYTIKNDHKQLPGKMHFLGVHGTNSFSIPTILTDGLLSHNELVSAHNDHWIDNGQALGNGIYMSQLSEASKSLNFSNNDDSHYNWLIVTDVAYNRPAHENDYNGHPNRKNYDFIFGDQVGWAHNYDEYVARYGRQIKIKYILALSRHEK